MQVQPLGQRFALVEKSVLMFCGPILRLSESVKICERSLLILLIRDLRANTAVVTDNLAVRATAALILLLNTNSFVLG